jgi:hypothetical protein
VPLPHGFTEIEVAGAWAVPSARGWFYWSGFYVGPFEEGATAPLGRRWVGHAKNMTGGRHGFFFQHAVDPQRKQRPAFPRRNLQGVLVGRGCESLQVAV